MSQTLDLPVADPAGATGRPRPDPRCEWCGRRLPDGSTIGRRRRYCAQACRQRAYENRHALRRGGLPEDAVVLSGEEFGALADRLYQVRCAAEDVSTALVEGAHPAELRTLVRDMVAAADAAQRVR